MEGMGSVGLSATENEVERDHERLGSPPPRRTRKRRPSLRRVQAGETGWEGRLDDTKKCVEMIPV